MWRSQRTGSKQSKTSLAYLMTCFSKTRAHWVIESPVLIQHDRHLDPFYIKEEFAPSDKSVLLKRQQAAHNLIAPHLRILQFLTSHFNANRLGSPHLRGIFQRLIRKTLQGLKHTSRHPLAREIYFQVILFAIRILTYSDDLGDAAKWRLKDSILSSALAWFSRPPRYYLQCFAPYLLTDNGN